MSKVLILGGYGNFGKRIARLLTRHNVPVIIAGRDANKAKILAQALPVGLAETAIFDVRHTLPAQLKALAPTVVINTCGPFQTSDYAVAETCIKHGAHYIDLADGRDFDTNIRTLDGKAKRNNVAVISGASTVPGVAGSASAKISENRQSPDGEL
jgi:saccharopine dehydrogenase-like NADP-dependent oxidoreductase